MEVSPSANLQTETLLSDIPSNAQYQNQVPCWKAPQKTTQTVSQGLTGYGASYKSTFFASLTIGLSWDAVVVVGSVFTRSGSCTSDVAKKTGSGALSFRSVTTTPVSSVFSKTWTL